MSRKRAAPGASPVGYQAASQTVPNSYQQTTQPLTDEQFLNWGAGAQSASDYQNAAVYNTASPSYPPQQNAQPSNQLTRRADSQVVTRPTNQNEQWTTDAKATGRQQQQNQEGRSNWHDDIDELLAKAQVARRASQSKRKQIPPFVLKLHSFLDNPKNTELIRWADDGKSFVVLNEDEFANKLIPELFKHNNYASFVRQLNMYGFHKKVGLSDNSMRASERKAKSPSEYWNPFFRQGYPDLLWLIQKPKNQTGNSKIKGRGKSEERDDEEDIEEGNQPEPVRMRPQLTLGPDDVGKALTQEQFSTLQQELLVIRNQQGQIAQMLGKLKREHDSLVTQANDYQNKHSRHEQSINAILTFLATLYNRSLQNHEGAQAQDIAKMFAQTMNQENKNGGKVEDYVLDLPEGTDIDGRQSPYKRQPLLLTDGSENHASTMSPSQPASTPRAVPSRRSSNMPRSPQTVQVEDISDMDFGQNNSFTPNTGQQQDMLNYINTTNAQNSGKNTPVADFSHVLDDLENSGGISEINDAQRAKLVDMFDAQPKRSRPTTSDGALISPSRSNSRIQLDNSLAASRHGLNQLEQMQGNLGKNIDNMTSFLQPLSPTGSIPGIGDGQDVPPPNFDIDNFLNTGDYFDFNDPTNANLDFSALNNNPYVANNGNAVYGFADDDPLFAGVDDPKDIKESPENGAYGYEKLGAGKVESLASSSGAPTPQQQDLDFGEPGHSAKRRRKS